MNKLALKQIFKNRILWKVYVIWFFRRIVPLIIIQVAVIIYLLKIFADKIFVAKVLENAAVASNFSYWEFLKYLISSFFQTRLLVQIAIPIILGVAALLLRDLLRALST